MLGGLVDATNWVAGASLGFYIAIELDTRSRVCSKDLGLGVCHQVPGAMDKFSHHILVKRALNTMM